MSTDLEETGPIDYLVVEFPGSRMTGEGLPLLVDLVEKGIIRVLDLVFVTAGPMARSPRWRSATSTATAARPGGLRGCLLGVAGEDDISEATSVIEPGNSAGILVYENVWAGPLAAAIRRAAASSSRVAGSRSRPSLPSSTPWNPLTPPRGPTPIREEPPMPGLIRGVARTAVVAGTATAVSGRVQRRQQGRWPPRNSSSRPSTRSRSTRSRSTPSPLRRRGPRWTRTARSSSSRSSAS